MAYIQERKQAFKYAFKGLQLLKKEAHFKAVLNTAKHAS